MKQCWYYDANKTLEQNKKIAEEKIKEKMEERKKKNEEQKKAESDKDKKDKDPSNIHNGTIAQLPPKTEKTGMCLMTQLDAQLYCEPCNLIGVGNDEVDFIYDTGTVSGVMGEKRKRC
jgi:SNF2 family DNA or RNA helicase